MIKLKITVVAIMAIVVLLLSILPIGCASAITGSGVFVTEQHDHTDFTEVDIGSAFDYTVTQSTTFSIAITADDNIIEHVNVSKVGTKLEIRMGNVNLRNVHFEATITMPELSALSVGGASEGSVNGFDSASDLSIIVSGASRLNMVDMTAGVVTATISGASNMTGSLNAS